MTDRRARNRREFPETAAMVDYYRQFFGDDVKLIWAKENGREIGTPDTRQWVACSVRPKKIQRGGRE